MRKLMIAVVASSSLFVACSGSSMSPTSSSPPPSTPTITLPTTLWTISGTGNNVFSIPSYVTKLHIVGTYTKSSSNFIVNINGYLTVNDLLGTDWGMTVSDGIYATHGGTSVEIIDSTSVAWTFTEVR